MLRISPVPCKLPASSMLDMGKFNDPCSLTMGNSQECQMPISIKTVTPKLVTNKDTQLNLCMVNQNVMESSPLTTITVPYGKRTLLMGIYTV